MKRPTTPTTQRPSRRPSRRTIIAASATALVVLVGGVLLAPRPPQLSTEATDDEALASRLTDLAGAGVHNTISAAVVTPDGVTFAGLGADEHTPFEIGSITKTFTSLLLAQAVERGEVALDDQVGDHLDLGDSDAATATLDELSTHRSGLPRVASSLPAVAMMLWQNYRGGDPYPFDEEQLLQHARDAAVTDRGTIAYSNLGVALLGQALAHAAGVSYDELVEQRILSPLDMSATTVPLTSDALPADAPTGFTASGRPAGAWTMNAYAPAGGIRSTAADMAEYARALLSGPGALEVDPATVLDVRHDDGEGQAIGLAWFTTPLGDDSAPSMTWHNGGTGGYRSMLALDRKSGVAVYLVGNTAVSLDEVAVQLLLETVERTAS